MDLGIFRRRRSVFWAWIVLPALCVVVCYSALHVYCRYVEDRMERRQTVLGILADVEQRMEVAKDVVCGFALVGDARAPAAEDVSSRIGELARRHGFMINSLRVKQSGADKDSAPRALEIELSGEGEMLALMQFLNELQSPQHLTVVEGASLRLRRHGDGTRRDYEAELTVRCFRDALQEGNNA